MGCSDRCPVRLRDRNDQSRGLDPAPNCRARRLTPGLSDGDLRESNPRVSSIDLTK